MFDVFCEENNLNEVNESNLSLVPKAYDKKTKITNSRKKKEIFKDPIEIGSFAEISLIS